MARVIRPADRDAVQRIVDGLVTLPTLPPVASRILEAIVHPQTTSEELARILSIDPALTARTLRLANSDFYGFPRKVGTVDLAVTVLGAGPVRDLVLTATVLQTLEASCDALEGLWSHSIASGVAARALADRIRYRLDGEAYAAGLLHDIGKVALRAADSERFHAALSYARAERISMAEAERALFGSDHAEIGAKIAERWGLPEDLVEAIAYHHRPERARRNPALTALTAVANSIAVEAGLAWPCDADATPAPAAAWRLIEPDQRRQAPLRADLVQHVARETERERALFAEFRGVKENTSWV